MFKAFLLSSIVVLNFNAYAHTDISNWLNCERLLGLKIILQNISPTKALLNNLIPRPGSVVASTTPRYYYHWTRDAALVIDSLLQYYEYAASAEEKNEIRKKLPEYLELSRHIQDVYTDEKWGPPIFNLGEAKFNVDGSAYNDFWGRPQNDGPALRAVSFVHWARILMAEGQESFVRSQIYTANIPANSVIKKDIEYISHHWRDLNVEPWEEVKGDHFYNRMVQRKSLIVTAQLARDLGDVAAAGWYISQAKEIESTILKFWDEQRGYFVATLNGVPSDIHDYKHSNLDISVLLGLLHGSLDDGFLPLTDPRVKKTVEKLIEAFKQTYEVNKHGPGVAIGRYPEDRYEGGNPWVLTTLAVAEYYYKIGQIDKGDEFVARVQYHTPASGNLNEQIDRNNGYMKSVEDLTWNYAAILTAFIARDKAIKAAAVP